MFLQRKNVANSGVNDLSLSKNALLQNRNFVGSRRRPDRRRCEGREIVPRPARQRNESAGCDNPHEVLRKALNNH